MSSQRNPVSRLLHRAERIINPFGDTEREVLPRRALDFIRHFAMQAKGPFLAAFVVGGLTGLVEASLYWALGWLIDILDGAEPSSLLQDNWPQLLGLLALVLFGRTLVLIAGTIVEQVVIAPGFYTRVRWQAFRRVIEQPYGFYQNDFAGRIATKVMQAGQSVSDFMTGILQTFWNFVVFIVLTFTILTTLDPMMGLAVAVWLAGYVLIGWKLMPKVRARSKKVADMRSVSNGRMVDAFTNIMAVKLFDSGRREHAYVREAMEDQLAASRAQVRAITAVRASVVSLSGLMMGVTGWLAVSGWMEGALTTGAVATAVGSPAGVPVATCTTVCSPVAPPTPPSGTRKTSWAGSAATRTILPSTKISEVPRGRSGRPRNSGRATKRPEASSVATMIMINNCGRRAQQPEGPDDLDAISLRFAKPKPCLRHR